MNQIQSVLTYYYDYENAIFNIHVRLQKVKRKQVTQCATYCSSYSDGVCFDVGYTYVPTTQAHDPHDTFFILLCMT